MKVRGASHARLCAALCCAVLLGCGASRLPLPPPVAADSVALPPAPPAAPSEAALVLPTIRTLRGTHGLTVQLVELPGTASVSIAAFGRGAGRHRPEGPRVVDALLERILESSLLSTGSSLDTVLVDERGSSMRTLSTPERAARTLEWMMGSLTELPGSVGQFAVAQRTLADAAALEHQNTWRAITEDLEARLYPNGSARVPPERLGVARIRETTYEEVRARHRQFFAPERTLVVIAGDFRMEPMAEWAQLLADKVAGPSSTPPPHAAVAQERPSLQGRGYSSGDELGVVVMVSHGPPIGAPDYAAYELAVQCYGRLFSSRINRLFRTERREAYGASCAITQRAGHSHLHCEVSIAAERAVDAVDLLLAEGRRMGRAESLEPSEVEAARAVALASLRYLVESPAGLSEELGTAFFAGLEPGAIAARHAELLRASPADIAAAAARYLPDHRPFVVLAPGSWIVSHPLHPPGGYAIDW